MQILKHTLIILTSAASQPHQLDAIDVPAKESLYQTPHFQHQIAFISLFLMTGLQCSLWSTQVVCSSSFSTYSSVLSIIPECYQSTGFSWTAIATNFYFDEMGELISGGASTLLSVLFSLPVRH